MKGPAGNSQHSGSGLEEFSRAKAVADVNTAEQKKLRIKDPALANYEPPKGDEISDDSDGDSLGIGEHEEEPIIDEGQWEDLTADGGVRKRISRAGRGGAPLKGQRMEIHYVGRLPSSGKVFDSTRRLKRPLKLLVGKKQVIKGLHIGCESMKAGEIATLLIRSDYGYGADGYSDVPCDATLEYEVEMLDVDQWRPVGQRPAHLLPSGREEDPESLLKKDLVRVEQKSESDLVRDSAQVTINYSAWTGAEYGPDAMIFDTAEELCFELDERWPWVIDEPLRIPPGLHLCIKTMMVGERAQFRVAWRKGFGYKGSVQYGVPAESDLYYEVELVNLENPKSENEYTFQERMDYAEGRRLRGNARFKKKEYGTAFKYYTQGHTRLDYQFDMTAEEKEQANKAKVPLMLNTAMLFIKKPDLEPDDEQGSHWVKVRDLSEQALKFDPKNVKGLVRFGMGSYEVGEYDKATKAFNDALSLDPNNAYAKRYITLVEKKLTKYRKKEKGAFGGMFK